MKTHIIDGAARAAALHRYSAFGLATLQAAWHSPDARGEPGGPRSSGHDLCATEDEQTEAVGMPSLRFDGLAGPDPRQWLKDGVVIIDVGINRITDATGKHRIVGDVRLDEALGVAAAITPVPGGVGPMTVACLLQNTSLAAVRQRGLHDRSGMAAIKATRRCSSTRCSAPAYLIRSTRHRAATRVC